MSTPKIDDVDRAILRALRDDGRLSVSDLARQANVSRANAYARIDAIEPIANLVQFPAVHDKKLQRLGHGSDHHQGHHEGGNCAGVEYRLPTKRGYQYG